MKAFYGLVQDIVKHLGRFMDILKQYYNDNYSAWKSAQIFPIEIDISSLTHINEDFNERLGKITDENNDTDKDDELINTEEDDILQSVLKVCLKYLIIFDFIQFAVLMFPNDAHPNMCIFF